MNANYEMRIATYQKEIDEKNKQIQMMWQGFEEGISIDEMNKKLFPEAFEEE